MTYPRAQATSQQRTAGDSISSSKMSSELQWLLVRKWNAYGHKSVSQGIKVLSKEPGNLRNVHTFKQSGLVQPKTIGIAAGPNGKGLTITTRKTKNVHAGHVKKSISSTGVRGNNRRSYATVVNRAAGYRSELVRPALIRASRTLEAQAPKKATPARKPRGRKAKRAAKAAAATEA
ncbi:uncharacterized protein L969DRAFT_164447 [Mixia osmundae IAM 14324]|uniref:Ribosomal eL28/Mak16 domain-containing protein n=1 Tax=Mixia osmundae (strain CBS 9802 / IAM 14324 / JCM 22182 / KY 12970) TaxID=764103 RepID=G7DX84_MIXOS|nr:uncharacterized protein L969DRAFT_164447 [Mixia osmundae IAM 14324]KEI42643.1 hypothetical protein L969DRAFT_164447 [Mixia osmundae IAM 14324]GAA95194.1 hypothetical protein E5Q_01849 [Mixia osmundae IAM 14324]